MVRTLGSHVLGGWVAPQATDGSASIVDAVTGHPVARSCTDGIDMGAVAAYAREVGGPALRAMTFHRRAALLKELVGAIADRKAELYEVSHTTGATTRDAWIDVDGGLGVLGSYSSIGRRTLPDRHVVLDGEPQPLSRDGTFLGVHVLTPREGVAVQVNAFNFPCWGSLEKLAPALLGGMPVIVKPATPTAHVAEALYRIVVDSGVLPDGALQFVAGSLGDLFDHLDGRDVVGFTGSASTAAALRRHPAFASRSARFVAETDSLNSCVLLPSAADDDGHLDRFVAELENELVTKAGQRCTAIRRALVPASAFDTVVDRLRARLAEVRVGDPAVEGVRMGPLVSAAARADVVAVVDRLRAGTRVVVGDDEPTLVGTVDPGAFLSPTVLVADDPWFDGVHDLEPFGPVTTLLPYRDVDEAIALVRRGGGSLVASVFGDAATDEGRRLFTGIAPYHGRVLFVDAVDAAAQTGHGSPLPHLVHGGPGRAGGGEELGGLRALHHYTQRTAVQGSPDQLVHLVGRYLPGATRDTSGPHPFRRTFDELSVGDALVTDERVITLEDIEAFAALSGDRFYAHMDEDAAAASPVFDGRVAHGYFLVSAAAGLFVWPDPGPVLANIGLEGLRFTKPVSPGGRIHVRFTCKDKGSAREPDRGTVVWDVEVVDQDGDVVAAYDVVTLVARATGGDPSSTEARA